MRVAFCSFEFPPSTQGGIGTYALHTVRMLVAAGHDVTVFAGTGGKPIPSELCDGARICRLPCHDRRQFHMVAVAAVTAVHRTEAFDVAEIPDLYAEGKGLRAALPQLPIILRAHTPLYIPWEIDFLALSPLGRLLNGARRLAGGLLQRQNLRVVLRETRARVSFRLAYDPQHDHERQVALEADLVVPPSRLLARRLIDDWRLPPTNVRVLPYAHAPAAELLALPVPAEAKTIAFHGSIRRFKGVHILAEALSYVLRRHPGARVVFAGASGSSPVPDLSFSAWRADRMIVWRDTVPWLREQLSEFADRVEFSGFIAPERLVDHLRAADICVFPSLFDNFPSACLEAMAAGRPIIATRSGGMEEMLADGAGVLVPPGNAQSLAKAICRLLEEPTLRLRLARRAREKILADYAPAVIGPRHEAIFAEAVDRHRGARLKGIKSGGIPTSSPARHD